MKKQLHVKFLLLLIAIIVYSMNTLSAQVAYSHSFSSGAISGNDYNQTPDVLATGLSVSSNQWSGGSNTPGLSNCSGNQNLNIGVPRAGASRSLTLTVNVATTYTLNLTGIATKFISGIDNGTFNITVNGNSYYSSASVLNTCPGVTVTQNTPLALTGTVTIVITTTNSGSAASSFSIDDFIINGTLTSSAAYYQSFSTGAVSGNDYNQTPDVLATGLSVSSNQWSGGSNTPGLSNCSGNQNLNIGVPRAGASRSLTLTVNVATTYTLNLTGIATKFISGIDNGTFNITVNGNSYYSSASVLNTCPGVTVTQNTPLTLTGTVTIVITATNSGSAANSFSVDDFIINGKLIKNTTGNALNFDGNNDYIELGNVMPSTYTKEAWIKVSGTSVLNNIIGGGDNSTLYGRHTLWIPSSKLSAGHNGTWNAVEDPATLDLNKWYHVAVTYDATTTTMKLYKNGTLVSTNTSVVPFTGTAKSFIGNFIGSSTTAEFSGSLDEVRIWNVVRTQSEIQTSMFDTISGNPTSLVAYYNFNQGIANGSNTGVSTLTDKTANANNGTLLNFSLTGNTSNWINSTTWNNWVGTTDNDYATATNWMLGTVPTSVDNIVIPTGANNLPINVSSNQTAFSGYLQNGTTLTLNKTFTIAGNFINNGKIVVTPNGFLISAAAVSNVTLQKSIIGQRGWRMFAYPFTTTQTFSSLASTNGIAISTTASGASGLTDVRSFTNGTTNGWNNVSASSTTANTPFALFIRGLASEVTGLNYNAGPSAFTFNLNGTLNASPFSITPSASNFTLVGNPFAAPVNSSALTNGTGKSYYVYQISQGGNTTAQRTKAGAWSTVLSSSATTPIPTLGVIAYQAGSASSYTVSTSDINTSNAATTGLFSTEEAIEHLELRVLQNGMQLDNLFVRQDAASSEKGTDGKDLQKLANEGLNVYTIAKEDNTKLAVDARNLIGTTTIPLGVVGAVGNYQLQVANLNIEGVNVSLKDAFTGTTTTLKANSNYEFAITTDAASKGENRFELVLNKVANNIAGIDVTNAGKMTAKLLNGNINKSSVAQLEITDAAGKVEIRVTDMTGRLLHTQSGQNGRNSIQLGRKAGVQLITITDGTTTINQKMVKQ